MHFFLWIAVMAKADLLRRHFSFFFQSPISFAEVALYFSREEWSLLNPHQRSLYKSVMLENHENVAFVGKEGPLASKVYVQTDW